MDMPYNRKVMKTSGLDRLPDRRTYDRRFELISFDIKVRIDAMGLLFINEGLIDSCVVSVDSALLKAKGRVRDGSNMKKNEIPRLGIDTDAKWDYSRTNI